MYISTFSILCKRQQQKTKQIFSVKIKKKEEKYKKSKGEDKKNKEK